MPHPIEVVEDDGAGIGQRCRVTGDAAAGV
jgi:hypothetical protein